MYVVRFYLRNRVGQSNWNVILGDLGNWFLNTVEIFLASFNGNDYSTKEGVFQLTVLQIQKKIIPF